MDDAPQAVRRYDSISISLLANKCSQAKLELDEEKVVQSFYLDKLQEVSVEIAHEQQKSLSLKSRVAASLELLLSMRSQNRDQSSKLDQIESELQAIAASFARSLPSSPTHRLQIRKNPHETTFGPHMSSSIMPSDAILSDAPRALSSIRASESATFVLDKSNQQQLASNTTACCSTFANIPSIDVNLAAASSNTILSTPTTSPSVSTSETSFRIFDHVLVIGSSSTVAPSANSCSLSSTSSKHDAFEYWTTLNQNSNQLGSKGRAFSSSLSVSTLFHVYRKLQKPEKMTIESVSESTLCQLVCPIVPVFRTDLRASQSSADLARFSNAPLHRGPHITTLLIRKPEANQHVVDEAIRLRQLSSSSAHLHDSASSSFPSAKVVDFSSLSGLLSSSVESNFDEYLFAICLQFSDSTFRIDQSKVSQSSHLSHLPSQSLVQVEAPLTFVILTRHPFFTFHVQLLTALFGCYRLATLSPQNARDLTSIERFQIEYLDWIQDCANSAPSSSSLSSWRSGLLGHQMAVEMWHTLADLVFNFFQHPPASGQSLSLDLPSILQAHLSQLTLQRPIAEHHDEWSILMSEFSWATALHCLSSPHQLTILLTALLLEQRILILDLPHSSHNPSSFMGDGYLTFSAVWLCLAIIAPLRWAGSVFPAVPPSLADFLSAPGSFIAALHKSHYLSLQSSSLSSSASLSENTAPQKDSFSGIEDASANMLNTLHRHLLIKQSLLQEIHASTIQLSAKPTFPSSNDDSSTQYRSELPPDCVIWIPSRRMFFLPESLNNVKLLSASKFCIGLEPLFDVLVGVKPNCSSPSTSRQFCYQPSPQQEAASRAIMHAVFKYNQRLLECALRKRAAADESQMVQTSTTKANALSEKDANRAFLFQFCSTQMFSVFEHHNSVGV